MPCTAEDPSVLEYGLIAISSDGSWVVTVSRLVKPVIAYWDVAEGTPVDATSLTTAVPESLGELLSPTHTTPPLTYASFHPHDRSQFCVCGPNYVSIWALGDEYPIPRLHARYQTHAADAQLSPELQAC